MSGKGKDNRGRSVPGPYPYAGRDSAESGGVELHGVSEGEEQSDDLREVPGTAV